MLCDVIGPVDHVTMEFTTISLGLEFGTVIRIRRTYVVSAPVV